MTLAPISSIEETDWLKPINVLSGNVGGLFPRPFKHTVALGHPGFTGTLPVNLMTELAQTLADCSGQSDKVYFCVWTGWGGSVYRLDEPAPLSKPATKRAVERAGVKPGLVCSDIPHRSYFVFEGALDDAALNHNRKRFQSPSMWWPANRLWFVATDVDAEATYIGTDSQPCTKALLEIAGAHQVALTDEKTLEPPPANH